MFWLLPLAFAADPVPMVKTPVTFPGAGLDLGVERVSCEAEITLAEDGTVADARIVDDDACPAPFPEAVLSAVKTWRYPRGDAGRTDRETFVWRLKSTAWPTMTPAELHKILEAHEVVPLGVEHCELRIRIAPDGGIASLRTSEIPRCLVMPMGAARNPKRLRKGEAEPARCTARFTSDRGVASDIDLSECPEKWQLPADITLRNWQWQTGPDFYEDYVVRFVFALE